jgi:hypothetical protein
MRLIVLSIAAASVLLVSNVGQAQSPEGQPGYSAQNPAPRSAKPQPAFMRRIGPGSYNKQAAIGAYGRAVYPKYTWGFHSRDLQNIGVPHGDIGTLGSGLQRDPW